jgi:N,N'-diacetyllegionaminate synthase
LEIIAEVGLAHDGSLSAAHAYIDACSKAGVDTVKFQCHWFDSASEWRVRPKYPQDESRQAYWERTQFSLYQWQSLAEHCGMIGREFMCSPFSAAAVRMLDPLVSRWKVPSGQIANEALLDAIAATGKPVLLSTGMSTHDELTLALGRLSKSRVRLLQCTTAYPCPPEQVGLSIVASWGGLSDHSGTIYPGIAAAALGCKVLEVHVCWSKDQGGFDTEASLDMGQLRQLVEGVRFIEKAMQPVDKDAQAAKLADVRRVFM